MTAPGTRPQATWATWDIKIRDVTLLRRERVTPRMLRLTFGGPQMAGFESHLPDEHCKLVFPDADGSVRRPTQDGDHLDWPRPFPTCRDYTIRRHDPVAGEIDLDFVVHDGGVASTWAQQAPIGSTLPLAGPRPSRVVPADFGFLVLLGDETALPALGRWLMEMPAHQRGVVAVEVHDEAEQQQLSAPAGVQVSWLSRGGRAPGTTTLLGDFVQGIELPEGEHAYVWAGGEAGCLKPVRRWARSHGFGKDDSDITGYWKRHATQDDLGRPSLRDKVEHAVDHVLRREH